MYPKDIAKQMDVIIARIKELREKRGMSFQDLADKTGMSKSTLQRYETGAIQNVPLSKLEPLAKALNTTPAYLMGWDDSPDNDVDLFAIAGIMPMPKTKKIPLIGEIACGVPILAQENILAYVDLPETTHNADFCLKCKGDSMINARIYDGDIVFVRQQPTVENGEIAVVVIDGEATLKRFYRRGNIITLAAENPNFEPITLTLDEYSDIRIAGKAIAFLSGL